MIGLTLLAAGVIGCFSIYVYLYYPRKAEPFEISAVDPAQNILIATQGSAFKKAMVTTLCDSLKDPSVRIRGIDTGELKKIDPGDWDKIIMINSFVIWLNRDIEQFVDRVESPEKLLLYVTSGGADWRPEPKLKVDALTSASRQSRIQDLTHMITDWVRNEDELKWTPDNMLLALLYHSQVDVFSACVAIASERERYEALYPNLVDVINQIGYEHLRWKNVDSALKIFKLNLELFPEHWNVYDSYGEALLRKGDRTSAIINYQRALELNPASQSTKSSLEKLRKK